MTRVEKIVSEIKYAITDKHILEVACGCAEFSIAASDFAKSVYCIDLEGSRLPNEIDRHNNVCFWKMDATSMVFDDEQFDVIVLYNAIGHLTDIIPAVISECMRVLKKDGSIYVISSFAMDKTVIHDVLLPHLYSIGILPLATEKKPYTIIVLHIGGSTYGL